LNQDGLPQKLLSRIEDAGLNASAPPQQRWIDGWLVRISPGKAQRARCINAVSTGLLTLDEKLALCQAVYRQAGLRMLLRITPFSRPPGLDVALAARGYERIEDTRVMVCRSLAPLKEEDPPEGSVFETVSSKAYAHIVGEFRGTPHSEQHAHAERLLNSPVPYRGMLLRRGDGTVLACGQTALEDDMVGLYDVFTACGSRGQGLACLLCSHLLAHARRQGASVGYLQVDAQNHAARAVYRRLGFVDAYSYHYRALPAVAG
jgi:ribosomal protein S18 acetylase RimI-like enzyme